ncbi:hypothetical protein BOX15_Mlig030932g3 [Macrostomum lignano]|uniref:Uncharacterized protein n=1 Tax=Macrostomum lignano TaxID=282301 RepID=A0A267GK65_9PLAT|nr:hypothetical protein BOX15_Mlig030932g3 [Macrostomum lignano]
MAVNMKRLLNIFARLLALLCTHLLNFVFAYPVCPENTKFDPHIGQCVLTQPPALSSVTMTTPAPGDRFTSRESSTLPAPLDESSAVSVFLSEETWLLVIIVCSFVAVLTGVAALIAWLLKRVKKIELKSMLRQSTGSSTRLRTTSRSEQTPEQQPMTEAVATPVQSRPLPTPPEQQLALQEHSGFDAREEDPLAAAETPIAAYAGASTVDNEEIN